MLKESPYIFKVFAKQNDSAQGSLKFRAVSVKLVHRAGLPFIDTNKIQKHFQNVMLVEMASEIGKNYTYKCVDRSRHNGIKGAKAKCAH